MSTPDNVIEFNDAVLRHLTIKVKHAVTTPSPMMKEEKSRSLTPAAPAATTEVSAAEAPVEAAAVV